MKLLDSMYDSRSKSCSVMVRMVISEYLGLVKDAYTLNGGLEGQRDRLKTTSALRIRKRMAEDLTNGAVLPPVVVGIILQENIETVKDWDDKKLNEEIKKVDSSKISIIDGMQRTTVFIELEQMLDKREIRVELWAAQHTANLTYRMLVLNTGQVPWNLRRQIEVVYSSLLTELESRLNVPGDPPENEIMLFRIGDARRRAKAGVFQASDVVEMYIAFGLRKSKVDSESVLADEFSRLDMIEAVSNDRFLEAFVSVFKCLFKLDLAFSKFEDAGNNNARFLIGRNLFDSQPACVGFVAGAAQMIFGRPGSTKEVEKQNRELEKLIRRCESVLQIVEGLSPAEVKEFLAFDVLNDVISNRTSKKIGDFEREFFNEAFRVFLSDDEDIESMVTCWRAY